MQDFCDSSSQKIIAQPALLNYFLRKNSAKRCA